MVSGYGEVVAALVHDVDEVLAVGQRAHGLALHGVACVHQRYAVRSVGRAHGFDVVDELRVSQVVVHGAMHVVRVHYDDGRVCGGRHRFVSERASGGQCERGKRHRGQRAE